jgi:hypothetical protein
VTKPGFPVFSITHNETGSWHLSEKLPRLAERAGGLVIYLPSDSGGGTIMGASHEDGGESDSP